MTGDHNTPALAHKASPAHALAASKASIDKALGELDSQIKNLQDNLADLRTSRKQLGAALRPPLDRAQRHKAG